MKISDIVGSKLILDYEYFFVNFMRENTKATLKLLLFIK